ncbi:hypothetical protein U9M48_026919 [Paspalum notatum var. saurae]|uniref:Cytochrome P450 n=1 Tax=Paspalum notatum var. saurae TaxID=547442 RepID=A0AAQ3TWA3_PASNO
MFLALLSIVASALLLLVTILSNSRKPCYKENSLPPAPWPRLPLVGNLFYHSPTIASLGDVLRRLHAAHGPVVSLWVGGKPAVFITCHEIAHRTLVHMGTTFAHRPRTWCSGVNSHGVNSADYGSRWGLLRRNLSSHLAAAHARTDELRASADRLVKTLESAATAGVNDGGIAGATAVVAPSETFRHAVFGFFGALCFGEGIEEDMLRRLRALHAEIISLIVELDAFHLMPAFLQVVCYFPRWRKLVNAQRRHHVLVTAIIGARRRRREEVVVGDAEAEHRCYLDTLLGLQLGEDEMVSLCWEYMNAAVKTTATALEWIMARLVLHQDIQQKLRNDIARRRRATAGGNGNHMAANGEQQRPFLEAVVLEALRLHPPAHYLLAHTTDKDVSVDRYVIPKGSVVNFGVASIGRDAALWTDPDVFRPERFMEGGEGSGVHCICTSRGSSTPETMKMIPFGAGRRACPGAAVAVTVLQAFVEDLVMRFEWRQVGVAGGVVGAAVDMTEKPGIITEMRVPLRTHLVVRQSN